MKRAASVFGVLIFFGIFIMGLYYFSAGKTVTRAREWAKGKIPIPASDQYDVIVVGSDPEGIAAALGAARSGAKTLLLGKEEGPGGLLTYGMLNTLDMSRNKDKEILTKGVFMEFYNAVGRTESFDVESAKKQEKRTLFSAISADCALKHTISGNADKLNCMEYKGNNGVTITFHGS